jgi:hypothetical protein
VYSPDTVREYSKKSFSQTVPEGRWFISNKYSDTEQDSEEEKTRSNVNRIFATVRI